MNVTIEAAYREACTALGEMLVQQRLMVTELERLTAENTRLASSAPDVSAA